MNPNECDIEDTFLCGSIICSWLSKQGKKTSYACADSMYKLIVYIDATSCESHVSETNNLLLQNVEALTNDENGKVIFKCNGNKYVCARGTDESIGREFIIHGILTRVG